jgi:hypothetical protein
VADWVPSAAGAEALIAHDDPSIEDHSVFTAVGGDVYGGAIAGYS